MRIARGIWPILFLQHVSVTPLELSWSHNEFVSHISISPVILASLFILIIYCGGADIDDESDLDVFWQRTHSVTINQEYIRLSLPQETMSG